MLTANGKALLKLNNSYSRITPTLKHTDADTRAFTNEMLTQLLSSLAVYIGTNSTEPTSADYTMQMDLASLTSRSTSSTAGESTATFTQDYIGIYSRTVENTTENNITISEVGLIGWDRGGFSSTKYVLIAREAIEPVTIAPGEAYTFTMYIG